MDSGSSHPHIPALPHQERLDQVNNVEILLLIVVILLAVLVVLLAGRRR